MTDFERADRLTRRRARLATTLAAVFLATQLASFGDLGAPNRPTLVHIVAWSAWAIAMLVFLLTGGGLWQRAGVKRLLNDETTRANRLRALATGFWVALACAAAGYGWTFADPLVGRAALRITVTIGVAATLLRFGMLERQALGA